MRKYTFFILVFLFVAFSTSCKKEKIDTRFWQEGTKAKYLVTYGEYLYENNIYVSQKNVWYESDLTMIKRGKDNEVLWQQRIPISKKNSASEFDIIKGDTLNYINGLKVRYSLTNEGAIKDVKNWNEIEKYFDSVINSLIENNKSEKSDFNDKEFMQLLSPFIKNHKAIEAKSLKAFQIFHSIYGIEFPFRDTVSYFYADFNGKEIKKKVECFQTSDKYYYLQITSKIDNFQIDSSTNELFTEIIEKSRQSFSLGKIKFNITDTCKVLFRKDICLPEKIRFWRWSEFDSTRHIAQYEIKKK